MSYRILELIVPTDSIEKAMEMASEFDPIDVWTEKLDGERSSARFLVDSDRTESLSDALHDRFSKSEGFRIMFYTVEATLPVPEEAEETEEKQETEEEQEADNSGAGRISREELYADVSEGGEMSRVYIGLVVLSTIVAGVGLIRDDVAVIIGAMVIAPLLGPNVSMSLAVTLGDVKLGWKSLKTNVTGLALAISIAVFMGIILNVNPDTGQILSKSSVSLSDITIALAAGSAGVLAYTRGVPAAIVGVMVAVALLPPLVNVGLLLGSGMQQMAVGAAILTLTNLICINLAGVLTFMIQGVRPRTWWEAEKARKATRMAITAWVFLLAVAAVIIWFWGYQGS